MKKYIIVILLSIMIITETIILSNQNKSISVRIDNIYNEFKNNNLVVDSEINLDSLIETKENLKEYTQTVFKNDEIEIFFKINLWNIIM